MTEMDYNEIGLARMWKVANAQDLKGVKPEHAFAMGVELVQFQQMLEASVGLSGVEFTFHAMEKNAERIMYLAGKRGRVTAITRFGRSDRTTWVKIQVLAASEAYMRAEMRRSVPGYEDGH